MSTTHPSLLIRVRDARDVAAWNEFVTVYAPLVHAYLRKRGVQDADAADIAQDVMQSVSTYIGRFDYDPARGAFRGWLYQITRNKLRDWSDKRKRQAIGAGDTQALQALHELPDAQEEEAWNELHAWQLFHWAAEKAKVDFREQTWEAFWRTSVQHESAKVVGEQLGMTAGAVHVAKCRVLARIKELLADVEP
jgi:RNA polymerase sigma factor (sigma-70 family)